MARYLPIHALSNEDFRKVLLRTIESGNLNLLIGSGASAPVIPVGGDIESQINALIVNGKEADADALSIKLLNSIQAPTNLMVAGSLNDALTDLVSEYTALIGQLGTLLAERKTTLLPKQASIFSTNYDLLVEQACINNPVLRLNDGFSRSAALDGRMTFSTRAFFNSTFNTGNLFNYRVEVPAINLIKLHGSVSWAKDGDHVIYRVEKLEPLPATAPAEAIRKRLDRYAVVLPQAAKFKTTLMDRTYYDLLRIYNNELDRENTSLLAFGFSFGDEHIRDITMRALKNPTLRLMIFSYDTGAAEGFMKMFEQFNNVDVVHPEKDAQFGLKEFNSALSRVLQRGSHSWN
ncbi:SIR2 family protein [Ramlibacter ginsenosidimutans]|uniref:SIR2 family protein n=1 Tax=Ramlibacter ginsenosidimutans TaxID=502333 RepID=A0A934WNS6_9BURK|nr:SIR2 family protein [Ramlibacter ginsenosidimutans]MBK6007880.1 SIR2 family protein [Ramlibacter ginsenosidimutans]